MPNTARRYHAFKARVTKAVGVDDLAPGEFVAIASVFDNIDSYGEVMRKGAFAESISEHAASGDPFPIIWQHDWSDPFSHIGVVKSIEETDEGLVYRGLLDIEDNPTAAQVYKLMRGRRITQQSFGFDVLDAGLTTVDGKDAYEITRVKLFEVGPCLVGVNQDTQLLGIKAEDGSVIRSAPGTTAAASGQEPPAATSDDSKASVPGEPTSSEKSSTPVSPGFSPASIRVLAELEIEDNTLEGDN